MHEGNILTVDFTEDDWITDYDGVITVTDNGYPFSVKDTFTYEDHNTLVSNSITHSQISETTIAFTLDEAGSVSLFYSTSSEGNYDILHVIIDDSTIVNASGEKSWTEATKELEAGDHMLVLRYRKDGSASSGKDAVAIGKITITGVHDPYLTRYLIGTDDKTYTVIDGALSELTGTLNAALFQESGLEEPPADVLKALTHYDLYKWRSDGKNKCTVNIQAVPNSQTLTAVADMSSETITGIKSATATFSGDVTISFSYDGTTFSDAYDLQTFCDQAATLLTDWETTRSVTFHFVLKDADSSLTRFLIRYKN